MIQTHRTGGFSTAIKIGSHQIVSDVPTNLGGGDTGANPHELLEAALGACTTITVQMYANRKGWPLESCDTRVEFTKEDKENILMTRTISFKGNLDETQRARLMEIAEKCPVHGVLVRGAKVETRLA